MKTIHASESALADPWWRLNNLYWIKNKQGQRVRFKMNAAQRDLYRKMWYLNVVLKARQRGMTTFIQLFMLDRCLWNDNQSAGIVAHNKEDAEAFFDDKIKFAYDNLPDEIKKFRTADSSTSKMLKFNNGSRIRVGTSLRSGTYQYVHISEYGKMCAKYPDKAEEVKTGTLNTVAPGQFVFVESTAEGPHGEFYDMCQTARTLTQLVDNGDAEFTPLDYKFFFYPWWWESPEYTLDAALDIDPELREYFDDLEAEHEVVLRREQQVWYAKKKIEQGDKMKQEYPSTPDEAFEVTGALVIYGKQLRHAYEQRRVCNLPHVRGVPVNTFWDLGKNDTTSIWLHQHVDEWHHFIQYVEGRLEDLTFYVDQLWQLRDKYGYLYGMHYLPHDVEVTDISQPDKKSRRQILLDAGLTPITVVARVPHLNDGIEMTRRMFPQAKFDREGCEVGLRGLHDYRWAQDPRTLIALSTPARTWGRNPADALRQWAQGYRGKGHGFKEQMNRYGIAGAPRKYMQNRSRQGTLLNPSTDHIR